MMGAVQEWSHDGSRYRVVSRYSPDDGAWRCELTGAPDGRPWLAIVIPAASGDGPFTPTPSRHADIHARDGQVPWPILVRCIELARATGHLVAEPPLTAADTALPLTRNTWQHDGRRYEVNQFHFGDNDSWCYELYEVVPGATGNNFVDVQIPDLQPSDAPFMPAPSDRVTLTMHGDWTIPWPVFRRFLAAIEAAGDIVGP